MSHLKSRRVIRIYHHALDVPVADTADLRPMLLRQLRHALRMRRDFGDETNAAGERMLDRTIFMRFFHCIDAGVGTEASQVIADVQRLGDVPAFVRRKAGA
jgi:hypothetical protein